MDDLKGDIVRSWLRLGVPLAVFFIAFAIVVSLFWGSQQTDEGRQTPVWNPTSAPSEAPPPTPEALPEGCSVPKPINPTRFAIERMGVDTHVLSLGWDATGAAAAPPDSDAFGVGWLNQGPQPGSERGNVVLTSHTYHVGSALGNLLYDAEKGLQAGDLIKMSDESGYTVCYRYREALKVWVAEYDQQPSDILYSDQGRPQLAMVVCWDWDWRARASQSRIIFYADPVVPAA